MGEGAFAANVGDEMEMAALETYLVVNGYARSSTVRAPGEFAVRGGLIDVYAPGAGEPFSARPQPSCTSGAVRG